MNLLFALITLFSGVARAQISAGSSLTVAIVSPSSGTVVAGLQTLHATASSAGSITSIQFKIDGQELGLKGLVSPYVTTWDSTTVPDGPHTLSIWATNSVGASTTTAVTIQIANIAPMILSVGMASVGSRNAILVWSTSMDADSQADFGTSPMYGSSSMLEPTMVSTHTVTLIGLMPGTTYHYRVKSKHAGGVQAISGDYTFTTYGATVPIGPVPSGVASAKSQRRFLTPANGTALFGADVQEVTIFDLLGRQIFHASGSPIAWNSHGAESGVYIAKIRALSGTVYQSLSVVK